MRKADTNRWTVIHVINEFASYFQVLFEVHYLFWDQGAMKHVIHFVNTASSGRGIIL
jgi:hypothetical protein